MTRTFRLSLWGAIVFTVASLLGGCFNLTGDRFSSVSLTNADFEAMRAVVNYNSLNITVSHPIAASAIQQAFHNQFSQLPPDSIKVRSCPCDTTLVNITLPASWTIEGQGGNLAARPPDGATEGTVALPGINLSGVNYPISTYDDDQTGSGSDETIEKNLANTINLMNKQPDRSIKIAVFDSGLNPGYLPKGLSTHLTSQCQNGHSNTGLVAENSQSGWNFVADGALPTNTLDSGNIHHGSRVANLLAKQFNGSLIAPHIIPMRVLDKNRIGDLFGLMCAMETARLNGVNVFNMSLGYYGAEDALLKRYFTRAVDNNIWIVVAAGNARPYEPLTMNRDLATMDTTFYPAAFSLQSGFDKLLVATTVLTPGGKVVASARQNYGQAIVLGVWADIDWMNTGEGRLRLATPAETKAGTDLFIFGTSYATPIITGRLARSLAENPGAIASSADLLQLMNKGNSGDQVRGNRFFRSTP
ncbi:S8/S53 family peptidase [Spirosoma aerolatum]|uniref:S8/S53 family peptidase n=1 Tax=Spirosoma aerolatum TaxID=1211326 RepID=UPI0009AE7683|nr:S8/S53 family peptidase [Spirosoma aerolatum]